MCIAIVLASIDIDLLKQYNTCYITGSVFAGIAVVEVSCSLVGHAISNPIYAATSGVFSGAVYLVLALCYFIGTSIIV